MSDLPVHTTVDEETKNLLEFYPPHPPRTSTPEYNATHVLLTHTLNMPCRDCGVRHTTLADPIANPLGAKDLETHHWPLQREFADAIDPMKVNKEYPEVTDRDSLNKFIDSPKNMLVLCVTGDTKVMMDNGKSKPIKDIVVGDMVVGHDLGAYEVTAIMNREVNEPLYNINGVKMTHNHPVLTRNGFVEASLLEVGQVIYQVGVFFPYMLRLRRIKSKVFNSIIRPIAIDMMNTFLWLKFTAKMFLHDISMLLHGTIFTAAFPDTNSYIPLSRDSRGNERLETTGFRVQQFQPTSIGTGLFNSSLKLPIINRDFFTANFTLDNTLRNTRLLTTLRRTLLGTGFVPKRQMVDNPKTRATNNTFFNRLLVRLTLKTGWISVNHISISDYIGKVYDIQVEGSHSFIANNIAVHNCDVDHRSPTRGIHHIGDALEACKRFIIDGYILDDVATNAATDLAKDAQLTASEVPNQQI